MRILPITLLLLLLVATALLSCAEQDASEPVEVMSDAVTLRFDVEGMHCTGCEKSIVAELSELPGVRSCDASFEQGRVHVVADDDAITELAVQKITDLGYTAVIHRNGE